MTAQQLTSFGATTLAPIRSAQLPTATSSIARSNVEPIKWKSDQLNQVRLVTMPLDDGEIIFDRLVALKLASADFATHLGEAWRAGLFQRLDDLLDADEWVFSDEMPSVASFKTFLRIIVHNKVEKRPSLGATADGKIIASWRSGDERLVVECFPDDDVRWVASRIINGKRVSGAGKSEARFLMTALMAYQPEVWFG